MDFLFWLLFLLGLLDEEPDAISEEGEETEPDEIIFSDIGNEKQGPLVRSSGWWGWLWEAAACARGVEMVSAVRGLQS